MGSRVLSLAALSATLLLTALLIDAAVETTLRGASVSLAIAGMAAVYAIVLVFLWRRAKWTTKAELAGIVLLGAVCVSAWMARGPGDGIVIARTPTDSVMAAVVGLGVLVAGCLLASLRIPIWARLFVVVSTFYGVAAFALALAAHVPYSALYKGQSFWTRAPQWVQGSYVGLGVLAAAVVAAAATATFGRVARRTLHLRWTATLALALTTAIGVAGLAVPRAHRTPDLAQPAAAPVGSANAALPPLPAANHAPAPGDSAATATDFDVALEENGGIVESLTRDDVFGEPLIDGNLDTVCWVHAPVKGASDVVLSFYKRQPVLIGTVVISVPDPMGLQAQQIGPHLVSVPKDVEVWASTTADPAGYTKIGTATFTTGPGTQTIAVSGIEARFVKIRVLSVQREPFDEMGVGISEIQVFEARRPGYGTLAERNPDLQNWKMSPRYAAQRGINWLQPATMKWQRQQQCFGCHIQAQSVMGLAIAKKNAYVVNDDVIRALSDYTESQQHEDGSYLRDPGEPSTQFAAMGLSYYDDLDGLTGNPKFLKTVDWLVQRQQESGELAYGVLGCQGDAVVQGPMMATANALVAFERAYRETGVVRYKQAADRGLAWIESATPVTTQDRVFKILALTRFGTDTRSAVRGLVDELIIEQRPSGGWRECPDHVDLLDPNPFSTGQVLYAFKLAGVSISSSPFVRGVKYLMGVQRPDGSWKAEPNTLHGQGAPYAPSMWAIIGLAGSFADTQTGSLQVAADAPTASARNIEIILDDSGSTKLPLGKSTRMGTARGVLKEVLAKLPDDMNVGLRVYAHRYSSRDKRTCTDTELMVPIKKLDRRQVLAAVENLKPKGETPLVYSILQSPVDLNAVGGGSVIVITDGEETCGGDPVAAAEQLKAAGLPITLNIVGFTLKGKDVEQQLTRFAQETGGQYYSAQDGEALSRALSSAALNTFPYEVFNDKGEQVAKGQAGPLSESLAPGSYKVVVQAGDQELTETATVTRNTNTLLKIVRRNQQFSIEMSQPHGQ